MKKFTRTVLILLCSLSSGISFSQFNPNENENHYDQLNFWSSYYDSISETHSQLGLTEKIPGFTSFVRWKRYWEQFMPSSGDYAEAYEIIKLNQTQLKKEHFDSYSSIPHGSSALIVNPVDWDELGPMNMTKIKSKSGTNWVDSHINNDGSNPGWDFNNGALTSVAHVGKIDRLFQHPTQSNIIYACAGGKENGGGGLFISNDDGYNWSILGTDQIPNPDIMTFAIKPYSVAPNPTEEYLFIGLSSGAVYRSADNGTNWIECNYNGINNYPFWSPNPILPNSLPYDITNQNTASGKTEINTDMKLTFNNLSTNEYSRLIVVRNGGMYYSDSYFSPITPLSNYQIDNDIIWTNMTDGVDDNFDIIKTEIPIFNAQTNTREFHFTDFESTIKGTSKFYFAHFLVVEKNASGEKLGKIRQYVVSSLDYGTTWSFLGGIDALNGPQKEEVDDVLRLGNIEVHKNDPNYLYIAIHKKYPSISDQLRSYSLKRFNLNPSELIWEDFSQQGTFYSPVATQPHSFVIDPQNDENWWFYSNSVHKMNAGIFSNPVTGYSKNHHADARDVILTADQKIIMATDGGVYQTDIGADDHILNATSEGINTAQSDKVGLSQKPPFYVASGFWHGGLQIYNPDIDTWHSSLVQDGAFGNVFFLNPERYVLSDQLFRFKVVKDFDSFNIAWVTGPVEGSENIPERSYGISRSTVDELNFNTNDYTSTSVSLTGLTFPLYRAEPIIIPNAPEKVAVSVKDGTNQTISIYNGGNLDPPSLNLEELITIQDIYDPSGTSGETSNFGNIVFDPRNNGKYWVVTKTSPIWGAYRENRIVEFDPELGDYIDLSYPTDDDHENASVFPRWLNITDLEIDRQTGVLYLGTTNGIYYLDRENEFWRKYSTNVPLFNTRLEIRHCTGEIFVSSTNRGIWHTDLIRSEEAGTLEWKIEGTVTWNDRMNLFCTLVVEPGSQLTIKNDLVVYGNQKIIVKPGGRLYIDGGKITSECGQLWKGIEVWGQSDKDQILVNQGYLKLTNGATIEHAYNAVTLWKPDDWNATGGIVQATNSHFLNNARDVEFIQYDWDLSGVPHNNLSFFSHCDFTTNDDFSVDKVSDHVTMYKVNGIAFTACDFKDERLVPEGRKGRGIFSIDAKYKVLGSFVGNTSLHEYYDETDYHIGTFTNLISGVEAMNANSQNSITVDHIKFENCKYGVRLSQVDNAFVTRNSFDRTDDNFGAWFGYQYDIYSDKSTAYQVEGNIMTTQTTANPSIGITIEDSGLENNEVYKNKLNAMEFGVYSYGKNRNDLFVGDLRGLEFLCDENTNVISTDELFSGGTILEGAKLVQGLEVDPAGNIFSQGIPSSAFHLRSDLSVNTDYFYKGVGGSNDQEPTIYTLGITPIFSSHTNLCPTNFERIKPGPGGPVDPAGDVQFSIQHDSLRLVHAGKKFRLDSLKTIGNRVDLHDLVATMTQSNKLAVKDIIMAESPYVSETILRELTMKSNQYFPDSWLNDVIIANIEVAKNPEFMQFLLDQGIPTGIYTQIEAALNGKTQRGIKEHELIRLEREKSRIANFMLKAATQDSLGNHTALFNEWSEKRGDALRNVQMADNYLARGNKQACTAKLIAIDDQIANLPVGKLRKELEDYRAFKTEMIIYSNSHGALEGLNRDTEPIVRFYAENAIGHAKVQAQNLLCFFRGECKSPPVPAIGSKSRAVENENHAIETVAKETVSLFTVFPNPAHNQVTVQLNEGVNATVVRLLDANGRIVYTKENVVNQLTIDISSYQVGSYTLQVENQQGGVDLEKLIIQ